MAKKGLTDAKLIKKLKSDNPKAVEQAVDLYGGYVFTVVKNILADMSTADIEETVADVFIKLWKSAKFLDNDRPIKPYLASIARNTAKNKRREMCDTGDIDQLDLPCECNIQQNMETSEMLEIVTTALDKADSTDREIFYRYYYNYERIETISKRVGLSQSAVKMRLLRTRKELSQLLEKRGYCYEG